MRELERHTLILNEFQVIDEIVKGIREVPDYYYPSLLIKKLYTYFREAGVEDILSSMIEVLDSHGYDFSRKYLEDEVKELSQSKQYQIYSLVDSIKIYKSEIDTINQLESVYMKKLAFSVLLLTKISDYKRPVEKRNNCTYYHPTAYLQYVKMNQSQDFKVRVFYELQQAGIITIPLTDYGFYCNIVANDGEVVYEITDNFDDCVGHFDNCAKLLCNEIILEVPVDSDELEVHMGYDKINPNRKVKNKKNVHISSLRSVVIFKRMSLGGSYWVEIPREIINDEDKKQMIANKLRDIASRYRKLTKTIGSEGILAEFNEFMNELA